MNGATAQTEAKRHPIRVVARRTGLSQDVLRAWEARYQLVTPARTPRGRRRYSDADIEKLRLLRLAVEGGRRIGEVADLSATELAALIQEDTQAAGARDEGWRAARRYLPECLEAIQELDARGLETTLERAALVLGTVEFIERVAAPLMRAIGDLWAHDRLTPAHERLASSVVRRALGMLRTELEKNAEGPTLVVATPSRQYHEMGALMAAVTAATEGWQVVYLGADLPAASIAEAAKQRRAAAVALSLVYPSDDDGLRDELRELRRRLSPETPIIVGGPAVGAYQDAANDIGAFRLRDRSSLREALKRLHAVARRQTTTT